MKNQTEGLLSVHSAVFLFGLTALFSKLISLNAVEISMLRSVFAVIALGLFIKYRRESLKLNRQRDYWVVLVLGVLLTAHWVTYFHAMQVSSIAIGIISLYTFPVITVFIEPLFHGEKPHLKDIVSAVVVFFGIVMLVDDFSLDSETLIGVFWGVLSAFMFALRNIVQGRYFKHYPARHALLYQTFVVIVALMPFSAMVIPQVTAIQWWQLLLLGVFLTALPHTLFANSLLHLKAKTASLVSCMQVVYGPLFALLFLAEMPEWNTIVGGAIIVSAAVYETWSAGKQGAGFISDSKPPR